jgi:hypothetical protein
MVTTTKTSGNHEPTAMINQPNHTAPKNHLLDKKGVRAMHPFFSI